MICRLAAHSDDLQARALGERITIRRLAEDRAGPGEGIPTRAPHDPRQERRAAG
jgi:hypothetical protein